ISFFLFSAIILHLPVILADNLYGEANKMQHDFLLPQIVLAVLRYKFSYSFHNDFQIHIQLEDSTDQAEYLRLKLNVLFSPSLSLEDSEAMLLYMDAAADRKSLLLVLLLQFYLHT